MGLATIHSHSQKEIMAIQTVSVVLHSLKYFKSGNVQIKKPN